jgi:hypothetical protein
MLSNFLGILRRRWIALAAFAVPIAFIGIKIAPQIVFNVQVGSVFGTSTVQPHAEIADSDDEETLYQQTLDCVQSSCTGGTACLTDFSNRFPSSQRIVALRRQLNIVRGSTRCKPAGTLGNFGSSPGSLQTSGDQSPIVQGVNGNVTIELHK